MENYTTIKKWTILTTFLKFIKTNAKKQKTKKNWHEIYAKSSDQENSQVNLDDTGERRALSQLHFSTLCLGLFSTFPNFFHHNKSSFFKSEIFFSVVRFQFSC